AATARNLGRPLPSLARQRRDLPLELCATIDEALDPQPERRPTLKQLRSALQQTTGELEEEGGLVEPATLRRFGLAETDGPRVAPALPLRVVNGAVAGVLVLLAGELLGPAPPVSSLPAAAAVGVAVALLPRLAWFAAAAAVLVWLGANDEAGTA